MLIGFIASQFFSERTDRLSKVIGNHRG